MSDTINVTVTPINVTVTTGVLGLDRSDAVNTRVLSASANYIETDDVLILNASAEEVVYTMPPAPSDNLNLTIVASDLSNKASINWNGKSFQDDSNDFLFFAAWEPLKVRFISSLDKWVRVL